MTHLPRANVHPLRSILHPRPTTTHQLGFNTDSRIGAPPTVQAVFGTMSVPNLLDAAATRESMEYFLNAGFDEVDTSILYEKAGTEETLGARKLSCSHPHVYCLWPSTV